MNAKTSTGNSAWIYWPEQCKYCMHRNENYTQQYRATKLGCDCEATHELINALQQVEHHAKGVYGSLDFKCDYFNLDEEAYMESNYNECTSHG